MVSRRKTGKTFYVREKTEYDRYLIVTRNKTLIDIDRGEEYTQREFQRILPLLIKEAMRFIDLMSLCSQPYRL